MTKAMPHMVRAVTGEPLHTSNFITFLIHTLIVPQNMVKHQTLGHTTVPSDTNLTPTEILLRDTVGLNLRDAASYFFASLASKHGDGRLRALKELVSAFEVGDVPLYHELDFARLWCRQKLLSIC